MFYDYYLVNFYFKVKGQMWKVDHIQWSSFYSVQSLVTILRLLDANKQWKLDGFSLIDLFDIYDVDISVTGISAEANEVLAMWFVPRGDAKKLLVYDTLYKLGRGKV